MPPMRVAAAVAAGAVLELEHARSRRCPARISARAAAEAGDAGADDDRADALRCASRSGSPDAVRPPSRRQVAALGARADPAAVVGAPRARARRAALSPGSAGRAERRRQRRAPAHRCTLPHSSSKVCTSTWFDRRFTSAGTRAMSGGKSNSAGKPATVRKRRPAGSVAAACRNGRRLGDDEAPLAEARHVRVVRRGREARPPRSWSPRSRSSCARSAARWSAPPRSRSPRGAGRAARRSVLRVELADREVGRVGEVDDDRRRRSRRAARARRRRRR